MIRLTQVQGKPPWLSKRTITPFTSPGLATLGLCAEAGIVVEAYEDDALGTMVEEGDGAGQFTSVVLRPRVRLAPGSDLERARALHHVAHEKCFIARSVNFALELQPVILLENKA